PCRCRRRRNTRPSAPNVSATTPAGSAPSSSPTRATEATVMPADLQIGGAPVLSLQAEGAPSSGPAFLAAEVVPGRGMMVVQASLRLASGGVAAAIHAPAAADAMGELNGGPDDFAGNRSFAFGGAILAPYANRITGRDVAGAREIETRIDGHTVRLPRNWGG